MSRFHLYRHYDANGDLLYVGQSNNAFKRHAQHEQGSEWTASSVVMRVEYFGSRPEALAAEREAILLEKPRYNRCQIARPRPKRGSSKVVMIRLQDDPLAAINEWRRLQSDMPNLSEAIRRLTAAGLEAEAAKKKGGRK